MIIPSVIGATHGEAKPQVYPPGEEPPTYSPPLQLDEIPPELRKRPQWMGTRFYVREDGKIDKPPYCVRRDRKPVKADKTNPDNWSSFEDAEDALVRGDVDAIGYVFTEDDPNFVIDYDGVIDPETGEIHPTAAEIIHEVDTYSEVSCSGTGVHSMGRGTKPHFARCKSKALGFDIEIYDSARFVVMTGKRITSATSLESRQDELEALCARLWPSSGHSRARRIALTPVDLDDETLLEQARRSRTGAKFRKLFDEGDTTDYNSHSEADFALMGMLIFWTAGDHGRIARLFKTSALYREDKGRGYVERSVREALGKYVGNFYRPRSLEKARQEEQQDPLTPYLELLLNPALWRERKGPSAYKLYAGMVIRATEHGVIDDGDKIRIGSDQRTLAEYAGLRQATVSESALPYLVQEMGLVTWRRAKKKTEAGTLVLNNPENTRTDANRITKAITQSAHTYFSDTVCARPEEALQTLRLLIRMRRGYSKSAQLMRLGMVPMFVTVAMVAAHGSAKGSREQTVAELGKRTGRRKADIRDALRRLKAAGIVREVSEDAYRLTDDFEKNYERELEESGITYSESEQRRRHREDRRVRADALEKRRRGEKVVDEAQKVSRPLRENGRKKGTRGASVREEARESRRRNRERVREQVKEQYPNQTRRRERTLKQEQQTKARREGTGGSSPLAGTTLPSPTAPPPGKCKHGYTPSFCHFGCGGEAL